MWSVASGPPRPSSFERAEQLIAQIPPQFLDRARDAGTVVPLILGLLLSDHEEARTVQHALIAGQYGRELADAAWTQANDLTGLHPLLRLPLAELSFPALRQRSSAERSTVVSQVIVTDPRRWADHAVRVLPVAPGHRRAERVDAAAVGLARPTGTGSPRPRRRWRSCWRCWPRPAATTRPPPSGPSRPGWTGCCPGAGYPYAPPAQGVLALENAWPSLVGMPPEDTQRLVGGVVATIADDGKTTLTELELLRTMCAILHCPLPL